MDIAHILSEHCHVIDTLKPFIPTIQNSIELMCDRLKQGGKIFWMGNGGSAADAQHMAAELVGRFKVERKAIASIALTTDSSILTCISNDYHFNQIFSRQLEALCGDKDVVIALSTSGNSENILEGIKTAKSLGAMTIGLTGHSGGALASLVDVSFIIPSDVTARIQEAHTLLCHIFCEGIEEG